MTPKKFKKGWVYKLDNPYKGSNRLMVFKESFYKKLLGLCYSFKIIADNYPSSHPQSLTMRTGRKRYILYKEYTPALIYIKEVCPVDYPLYINLLNKTKDFEDLFKGS